MATFPFTGRGVGATRNIFKGETILTIRDVFTARYIIENCLDIRLMLDTMNRGGRIDVLDLMLIWLITETEKLTRKHPTENEPPSPYAGYVKSLPLDSTCPLAVPKELWGVLPNQTRVELNKDYDDLLLRFQRLERVVKSSYVSTISNLSFVTFKWAYWVIRSRWVACYDYDLRHTNREWLMVGTDKDTGALCPWFDMCNHSESNANVTYSYSSSEGMVMKCVADIREGQEILISYSARPDDDMFLDYGFASGDNEESHLIFMLSELVPTMESRLYLTEKQVKTFRRIDDRLFRLYEDGIGYELEYFISDSLVTRDAKCLGGDNEQLFRDKECLDFLIAVCKKRRKELDDLDQESVPFQFRGFGQAAKGLRQIHRDIIDTSIEKFTQRKAKNKLLLK